MMARRKKIYHHGQAIIELIIALSALTIAFLGSFSLLSRSLHENTQASTQVVGLYLAADGIELVKNLLDANILQLQAWDCGVTDGAYHVDHLSLPPSGNCPGMALAPAAFSPDRLTMGGNGFYRNDSSPGRIPTIYNRQIIIRKVGTPVNEIIVTSRVWTTETTSGGATTWSVDLEDHFLKWRPS